MITLRKTAHLSEIGKRQNNEDCVRVASKTFVVCDGVGGAEKGEVASEITATCFISNLGTNPDTEVSNILRETESKINSYLQSHPEAEGMATTLTLTHVKPDSGILAAWVGDSRIYQFRNGQIIFQSKDHSWVNEAVEAGIISAQEAIGHPKSNVITRAIQGAKRPVLADTILLTDIQTGDYFLQCSDGVLESWSNQDLCELFVQNPEPSAAINDIKAKCQIHSRDNYSAIVYSIEKGLEELTAAPYSTEPVLVEAEPMDAPNNTKRQVKAHTKSDYPQKPGGWWSTVILSISLIINVVLIVLYTQKLKAVPEKSEIDTTETETNSEQQIEANPEEDISDPTKLSGQDKSSDSGKPSDKKIEKDNPKSVEESGKNKKSN